MNISYNWLKDLIDIDLSAEETAAELTRVGLAVEGIEPHGDDLVLDIDLTSNRPDCLSHLGVARELSVITGKKLNSNAGKSGEDKSDSPDIESAPFPSVLAPEIVKIEAPDACYRFTARIIKGVKIGPSPKWLVDRLEAIGERSINNVADITNYVMHETGQPMHAFDLDKLTDKRIVVRYARTDEKMTTLDEVERELDGHTLVICDAEKPLAVGGVMGGSYSGITDETVNVLLEVAYFNRDNIRRTSRYLNLATEASYHFERGVDIDNVIAASDRATELILELAGGEAADIIDIYPKRLSKTKIPAFDLSAAVKRHTGLEVDNGECERILNSLGIIKHSNEDESYYISPTWRYDITIKEDLVEEIARHAGYENIAEELPPAFSSGEYQPAEDRKKLLRNTLTSYGFNEVITYSFIDKKHDETFALQSAVNSNGLVELQDAVIDGAARMRPTLIPGLLDAAKLNFNQRSRDLKFFEIGRTFTGGNGELPVEQEMLGILLTGGEKLQDKAESVRQLDFYDAKGSVESALSALGYSNVVFKPAEVKHFQPGQTAEIYINGIKIGNMGRLNQGISSDYKFKQPIFAAEINIQSVLSVEIQPVIYKPLPRFPAIMRDVSLLVKRDRQLAEITGYLNKNLSDHCQKIEFVDLFESKDLAADERSLTLRFIFRNNEGTLTDDDIDQGYEKMITDLEKEFNLRRR